jgi:hypothetical protein
MHVASTLVLAFAALFSFACQSPTAAAAPTPAAAAAAAPEAKPDDAKAKADAKKQKQKELRGKQRELEAAKAEQRIGGIDRRVRRLGVDAALAKTASDLARVQAELDQFLQQVRPRELAAKKLELDQETYHAEHSKDELGELTAMYEKDEFAAATKELVIKRGRRSLEVAERRLALAKQESAFLETVAMPQRERDLRQRVADAELERRKAEIDGEKAGLEVEFAEKREQNRLNDLEEDIAELTAALAKEGA